VRRHFGLIDQLAVTTEQETAMEDDDYDDYEGQVTCWNCGGNGVLITCIDDMCVGGDHCIHGDGEIMCPECEGDGYL
jgi:hypothetical protein